MAKSLRIIFLSLGLANLHWLAAAGQDKVLVAQVDQQRELLVGHDVIHDEKINADNGQLQLLFTDQSTLTVSKYSALVIDEFVFDPPKQAGNFTATLATGLFRYVGGKISKQQDVIFKTPTGSISVRGGIVLIKITGDSTTAIFLYGERMTMTAHGASQSTTRPNMVINSTGGGPTEPSPATTELINEWTTELAR